MIFWRTVSANCCDFWIICDIFGWSFKKNSFVPSWLENTCKVVRNIFKKMERERLKLKRTKTSSPNAVRQIETMVRLILPTKHVTIPLIRMVQLLSPNPKMMRTMTAIGEGSSLDATVFGSRATTLWGLFPVKPNVRHIVNEMSRAVNLQEDICIFDVSDCSSSVSQDICKNINAA